jgi:hypothetical protein
MYPPFSPIVFNDLLLNGVRVLFYIGFFFYIVFAFIALRQIEIMRKTVITPFSPVVLLLGFLHLLVAVGALLLSFITLV